MLNLCQDTLITLRLKINLIRSREAERCSLRTAPQISKKLKQIGAQSVSNRTSLLSLNQKTPNFLVLSSSKLQVNWNKWTTQSQMRFGSTSLWATENGIESPIPTFGKSQYTTRSTCKNKTSSRRDKRSEGLSSCTLRTAPAMNWKFQDKMEEWWFIQDTTPNSDQTTRQTMVLSTGRKQLETSRSEGIQRKIENPS